jgi:hypothetical protein
MDQVIPMVIRRMLRLKRDHPVHYWTRLLLMSWMALSLLMAGAVRADTPAGDEQEIQSGSALTGYNEEQSSFCRQMNGTLWVFSVWRDPADTYERTLYGYFSSDNGTTWSTIIIADEGDAGYETNGYPVKMIEAHALSNNSIVILFYDVDYWGSSGKTEITIMCHWNNSDLSQWERVQGYAHTTYSAIYAGSGVNETDKIKFGFRAYTQTHYVVYDFDPADRSVSAAGSVSNKYPNSPKGAPKGWFFWNNSDCWNMLWTYEPGTGTLVYCWNASDGTVGAFPEWTASIQGYDSYIHDIVLTGNGTYVWTQHYGTGSYYYYWPYLKWYSPETDTTGAAIKIHADSYWGFIQLGLSNYDNCFVFAVGFNYNTDRYGAWGARYYRNAATWQGTHVDYFQEDYNAGNTWRYNFAANMPYQLYPRLESNYTQLPAGLGFPNVQFSEYDSGDSASDLWVDYDTTWPGVRGWTYWPEEPGPGPGGDGNATASQWYLWWGDASCMSGLIIAIIAGVILVTFMAWARRY